MFEDVPVLVGLELDAVTRCVRSRVVLTVNVTVPDVATAPDL
jgi:hypothetical protein